MDRPASVTAAILGVVLIAITVPYFLSGNGGATAYTVSWSQPTAGEKSANAGAANAPVTVTVPVSSRIPSNATISFQPCQDGAQPPLSSAATITWTLKEGDRTLDDGTLTCAQAATPTVVALGGHPNVASSTADSGSAAERAAESGSLNRSATYTLTFSWSRPGGVGGLPVPPPAFSVTGSLEVKAWHATANTPDQEAPR
jgi:hypothetical protein